MSGGFSIQDFKKELTCGGARPTLFEVLFHNLEDDAQHMKFLCFAVDQYITRDRHEVEFSFYEREDAFVQQRIMSLEGPITIREYAKDGSVAVDGEYEFIFESARNQLNWGFNNEIKQWTVRGYLR